MRTHDALTLIFVTTLELAPTCQGLAASRKPKQLPDLKQLAPTIYGNKLNYRVAVGDKETPFQMKNLHVELSAACKTPQSRRSTGIHDATVLQNPTFINDNGLQTVQLLNGGWQVNWNVRSDPHGFVVCSFVTPQDFQRNENAKLEKGRFFMYHRCWTTSTLASERERRIQIQQEAAKALGDRDEKIKEITDEQGSVASKVVSYAKAAKSMNDYRASGMKEASYIPLYDHQVLELTPDCIVSSRGLVYKVDANGRRLAYIGESRVDFLKQKQEKPKKDE